MTKYCIYAENIISRNHRSHSRLFRETQDGDRLPITSISVRSSWQPYFLAMRLLCLSAFAALPRKVRL